MYNVMEYTIPKVVGFQKGHYKQWNYSWEQRYNLT